MGVARWNCPGVMAHVERARACYRPEGHRLDDPGWPRPASADHRRRKTGRRRPRRHDHNQRDNWKSGGQIAGALHLRGDRPEGLDRYASLPFHAGIVASRPRIPPRHKYMAPYTGSAIGQHWMYQSKTSSSSSMTCPSRPRPTVRCRCCCAARRAWPTATSSASHFGMQSSPTP